MPRIGLRPGGRRYRVAGPVALSGREAEQFRSIVFFSDREVDHGPRELPGHLYLMHLDDRAVERLAGEPLTSTFAPDFSPDGRTVLFARDFDGDIDLLVLNLETREESRLPGTPAAEYGARYSPDGTRIAFHAAGEGDEVRIVVMSVDGSDRRDLTRGAQHYDPTWSPGGRWLVFTGAPLGATQYDLLGVLAGGGEVRPLVATEADERSGSWRPFR